MEPTLANGDIVLLTKTTNFDRGELCSFSWNNKLLIKRVIGLAGDRIRIDEKTGIVYRNNEPLDEPYVLGGFTPQRGLTKEITVPAGTLFVLGDNRSNSLDSRMLGPLPMENLVGRVLFRLAPNTGLITDGE